MDPIQERQLQLTRRHLFSIASGGVGLAALNSLTAATGGLPGLPTHAAKAKRVIYLFQHGGPSQLDLFDYKTDLE